MDNRRIDDKNAVVISEVTGFEIIQLTDRRARVYHAVVDLKVKNGVGDFVKAIAFTPESLDQAIVYLSEAKAKMPSI